MTSPRLFIAFSLLLAAILPACQSSTDGQAPAYDRAALLEQAATKAIIPAYISLARSADSLVASIETLQHSPNQQSLEHAQAAQRSLQLDAQGVLYFDFGPAQLDNLGTLNANLSTFPADTTTIRREISVGTAPGFQNRNYARRGLAALDFLLFAPGNLDSNSLPRRATVGYALALAQDVAAKSHQVSTAWESYYPAFIASTGTEAGSSTSLLYNAMISGYELVKNFKIGLPAGTRIGQSGPEPDRVEARYAGQDLDLLKLDLQLLAAFYQGNYTEGTTGQNGFEDYLRTVSGGGALATSTLSELAALSATANVLPQATIRAAASGPDAALLRLATDSQRFTHYLKSDMSSLLGIAITYNSADGD